MDIKGITLKKGLKVSELVKQYGDAGLQATHLAKAVSIIRQMRKEKALIMLSFTSNMVSSGLRELFAQLCERKDIDIIITSIGSVEEDLIKTKLPFLHGDFHMDDHELRKKGINRIGNILVPNDRYEKLEDMLTPIFTELYDRQKKTGVLISPSQLIRELGLSIPAKEGKDSFLYWAAKNNIPVYCPAPTDGALGLQLYFFKQKNPGFGIDVTADMKQLGSAVLNADRTGGILLGGGFAKHYAIGVNILREGFDYAIYVTTATPYDGSLSGARTSEAISWNKIKDKATTVTVEGDASIIFPLVAQAAFFE